MFVLCGIPVSDLCYRSERMDIDPTWPQWLLRQEFACVFVGARSPAAAVELAAKRLGHMGGWEVSPSAHPEVFRREEYREHARPGDYTRRASSRLVRSGPRLLHASRGTKDEMNARWLRHAVPLLAVVVSAWYGVEQGSRGGLLLAGAGALAWLVWPEASRFLAWRHRRRAEGARDRLERAVSRADRDVAKAERARERADRRPTSARRARRAERMETRALRAVARAERARERAQG